MRQIFPAIITLSVLGACSQHPYHPESIGEKMSRFQSKELKVNVVPKIQVLSDFKVTSESRTPASTEIQAGKNYSNKKLYFLTMYAQYNDLKKYGSEAKAPDIKHCPNFHNSFLDAPQGVKGTKKYQVPKNFDQLDESTLVSFYPEFSLPVQKTDVEPRVIDLVKQNQLSKEETEMLVTKAIDNHLQKTYSELESLCDTGSSSNYYLYENLISYVHSQGRIDKKSTGLHTLFKTTLFSNRLLLTSLKDGQKSFRSPASVETSKAYNNEVAKRVGVKWLGQYFGHLVEKRSKLK